MQETEIKVSFNDGGMMKQLEDMLSMLDDIQDRARGVEMPSQGDPDTTAPTPTAKKKQVDQSIEQFMNQVADTFINSVGASASGVIRNVSSLVQTAVESIPVIGSTLGGMVGAYGQLKATSLEKRQEMASQIMNMEGLEAQILGLTGESGRDIAESQTKKLSRLGFTPDETRSLIVGIGQSFGRELRGTDIEKVSEDLAVMQRTGVNAQNVASLAGAIQQGTGQSATKAFDTSFEAVRVANQLGLVGAGVDQFTGSLNSMVSDLTQKGIRFDPREILKFTQGMGVAFKDGMAGMRPMQLAQSLMGVAGGAGSSFKGNFSQLASTIIQAEVFSKAKNPLEAFRGLEEMEGSPDLVRKTIIRRMGKDAETILASISGVGTEGAKELLGKGATEHGLPSLSRLSAKDISEAMPLTSAQAEQTRKTLEAGRKDEQTMQTMIELQGKMDRTLLKFSENEETVLKVYDLMIKALEKIEAVIP